MVQIREFPSDTLMFCRHLLQYKIFELWLPIFFFSVGFKKFSRVSPSSLESRLREETSENSCV
jgi:hypothetical protein